jgi:hypothetical protein
MDLKNAQDAYDLWLKGCKTAHYRGYLIYGSLYRPIELADNVLDYLAKRVVEESPAVEEKGSKK